MTRHPPAGGPRGSGAAAPGGALRAIDPSAWPRSWRTFGPRRLRRQSRPALVATQGGGGITNWLFHNQLVDEITLLTYPLILGQGTRLFPDTGPDTALDLVDSRATPSGVIIQVYRPAGRPQYATATAD
jgi:hypothetical protein